MKRIPLYVFLVCLLFCAWSLGQSSGFRLLGTVKNHELLFDGEIHPRRYVELDFTGGAPLHCTVLIPSLSNVTAWTLWFIEGHAPGSVEAQFSQDLFQWSSGRPVRVIPAGRGLRRASLKTDGMAALFVRFVFSGTKKTKFRMTEIRVASGPAGELKKISLLPLEKTTDSVTLLLKGDADFAGMVRYGQALENLQDGPVMASVGREHKLTISGLERGTDYVFLGVGRDLAGRLRYTAPFKIRTEGIPLPKWKEIRIGKVSHDVAEFICTANVPVRLKLDLSFAGKSLYTGSSGETGLVHRVILSNLPPERSLLAGFTAEDRDGNRTFSDSSFRTLPENAAVEAVLSGDFILTGENLGPVETEGAIRRLADGDLSYHAGSVMSLENFSSDRLLVMDFGSARDLSRLDLVWWALAYASSFRVEVSEDGVRWREAARADAPEAGLKPGVPVDVPCLVTRVPLKVTTRWLRCVFPRGTGVFRFPQYRNIRILEAYAVPEEASQGPVQAFFVIIEK